MSHEAQPSPPPTAEELSANVDERYAKELITFNDKTMTLQQFTELRDAFCPVKPEDRNAAADLSYKVKVLEQNGVKVDETITSFVLQYRLDRSAAEKTEIKNANNQVSKEDIKQIKDKQVSKNDSSPQSNNQSEVLAKKSPVIHPEIMARVVALETPKKIIKPIASEPFSQLAKVRKVISVEETEPIKIAKTELAKVVPKVVKATVTEKNSTEFKPVVELEAGLTATEITIAGEVEIQAEYAGPLVSEAITIPEYVDSVELGYELEEDSSLPGFTESLFDKKILAAEGSLSQFSTEDFSYDYEIEENVEKTPAVAAAEFMIQVFPAVTREVYERVQEMEPVEAAEVAARIEAISIVADRLHELVVRGKTDGEEAQQIEAYLKREYEQLLVSVGIEPTQEILNEFIRYVSSADYQIQAKLNMNDIEVIDEGTHEKKLFDEQGVFARAHAASVNLSRRLDMTIGRLVVNYFDL